MTPSEQQKQWLKDYLYQTMQYRETYEEVYDHMLVAIENAPEQKFFESVVADIITADFGSNNGLYDLEQKCLRTAVISANTQYVQFFKSWFAIPRITVSTIIFLFLLSVNYLNHFATSIIFVSLWLVFPVILFVVRKITSRVIDIKSKPSVRDEIFRRITFRSTYLIWIWSVTLKYITFLMKYLFNLPFRLTYSAIADNILSGAILALMIVHILSVIELYRSEFKTQMILT